MKSNPSKILKRRNEVPRFKTGLSDSYQEPVNRIDPEPPGKGKLLIHEIVM